MAPQTGDFFGWEFSHLDGMWLQIFLDKLAEKYPTHLNVIQLDNGKLPHSSSLKIPSGYSTDFLTTLHSRIITALCAVMRYNDRSFCRQR